MTATLRPEAAVTRTLSTQSVATTRDKKRSRASRLRMRASTWARPRGGPDQRLLHREEAVEEVNHVRRKQGAGPTGNRRKPSIGETSTGSRRSSRPTTWRVATADAQRIYAEISGRAAFVFPCLDFTARRRELEDVSPPPVPRSRSA